MTRTEKQILDAAMRLFARYGVRRTSMADLAREAGVSRQTLYNLFRNKDEILRALIRAFTDEAIDAIERELAGSDDLAAQLDTVFAHMVIDGFDMVQKTPNAEDLIDGFNAAGQEEIAASTERFRALIERLLQPYDAELASAELEPPGLADFVQRAAKAAVGTARDRDHLLQQLETLKALCLAAARPEERSRR